MKNMEQDDIKIMIAESLYENNLIDDELYEKCGKPHLSSLPHDLRTNDPVKLQERKDAILSNLNELSKEIDDKYPEEFFEKSMVSDDELYDFLNDEYKSYDGQKLVDYYDNLLNTKDGLNDMVRDIYDEHINNINDYISTLKNDYSVLKKDNDESRETIESLKQENKQHEIDYNDATTEYFDLQKKISDVEEINTELLTIRRVLNEYGSSEEELRNNPEARDLLSRYDELSSKFNQEEYDKLQEDLRRTISDRRSAYETLEKNRVQITELEGRIFDNQVKMQYTNNEINSYGKRASALKSNKPNKNQGSNESYQELVDKKNLAISFKNDIRKAQDYQNELRRVNESLGFEGVEIWDGLPEDGSGGYIGF